MIGRRFNGGVDLSGGEWQKIALGRAYMRDAQLLILDEPTAALDARAEYEVFQRFNDLTQGKTAILISHRFSTVRMADRILVIENGQSGNRQPRGAAGQRWALRRAVSAAGRRVPVGAGISGNARGGVAYAACARPYGWPYFPFTSMPATSKADPTKVVKAAAPLLLPEGLPAPEAAPAPEPPLRVVIIRHGEKPEEGDNLSCAGLNRALALPAVLARVFATRPVILSCRKSVSGASTPPACGCSRP